MPDRVNEGVAVPLSVTVDVAVSVVVGVEDGVVVGVAIGAAQHAASSVTQHGTSSSMPTEVTCTQPASRSSAVTGPLGSAGPHSAWPLGEKR